MIYKLCGLVMLGSICIIAVFSLSKVSDSNQITFWFETVALIAFGISWLTKGEALFGDKKTAM